MTRSLAEAFGFPEASLAELEKKVLQFEEPRVFILEHAHHLFLRTIGGFEGLRAFLLFLAATSERVLWVLSMNEYTWRYLDPIVHISDYFPFQIETTNMSGPELEKTIMARHGLSGYRLRFRKGEALSRTLGRQLKKAPGEREEQAVLRKAFFEKLNSVSKGNVQIGLFYWLRSIENLDGDIMEIAPLEPLRFDFLSHLSVDKLFTLAAIVLHGTLNVDEHARVFHTSQTQSRLMLESLVSRNVIQSYVPEEPPGELTSPRRVDYILNPVMRRPIIDLLYSRNIFY